MKLNGNHILMVNFSKLRKWQTFLLIELHNLSKCQLADIIFKLWKAVFTIIRSSNIHFLKFWHFNSPAFKRLLSKFLLKNLQVFRSTLKVLITFYSFTNIYDLKFLDNETTALWIFLKLARRSLLLLKFCQMKEILKPQFCWYF